MTTKYIFRYPILIIGILLMVIFMFNLKKQGYFTARNETLKGSSCRSALVMLNKRIPQDSWVTDCLENNMKIKITKDIEDKRIADNKDLFPMYTYRELANAYIFVANNTLNESLERTETIRITIENQKMSVESIAEGKTIAPIVNMKDPKAIAMYLKHSIKFKETFK